MRKLKKLATSLCLISALATTVLAGEIQSPPCSPPDPGEIQSPPCSTARETTDDPTHPTDSELPSTADTIVIGAIAEAAVGAFLSVL